MEMPDCFNSDHLNCSYSCILQQHLRQKKEIGVEIEFWTFKTLYFEPDSPKLKNRNFVSFFGLSLSSELLTIRSQKKSVVGER